MKIMFVSDIHGSNEKLDIIKDIYYEEKPDRIIFLGDLFYGSDSSNITEKYRGFNNAFFIQGNCDRDLDVEESFLGFMKYFYFETFGKVIFCTHGHIYNKYYPPEVDFDIFVSGHTHIGMIEKERGKYYLNPGSTTIPRGGSRASYMIIDENGIYLKDLERNIIEKSNW